MDQQWQHYSQYTGWMRPLKYLHCQEWVKILQEKLPWSVVGWLGGKVCILKLSRINNFFRIKSPPLLWDCQVLSSLVAHGNFREIPPLLWNAQMTVWGQCSHSTTILWHHRTCGKSFRAQIGCLEATRVAMLSIIPQNAGEKTYLSHYF